MVHTSFVCADSGNAGPEAAEGVRTSAQQPPEGFCEDARLRSQRHQHEQQEEQQQQQNHHHRHQFATQNTVPIPPTPLLAVQPQQLDARPLIFGDGVTSAGGHGDTNTIVPLDAGNSLDPTRIGASRTGFGGERGALLSMEDVRVEPSRKVSETYRSQYTPKFFIPPVFCCNLSLHSFGDGPAWRGACLVCAWGTLRVVLWLSCSSNQLCSLNSRRDWFATYHTSHLIFETTVETCRT